LDIQSLIKLHRRPRKQTGQIVETNAAWFVRYSITEHGKRVRRLVKLVDKSPQYPPSGPDGSAPASVKLLAEREINRTNADAPVPSGAVTVASFVEDVYLPHCDANTVPVTATTYRRIWQTRWKDSVGSVMLANLRTEHVTRVLTDMAEKGLGSHTLSHAKWFLSGVYVHAIAKGAASHNPVVDAQWLKKMRRAEKQPVYTLEQVVRMLAVLEPVDLRAAVAVAVAFFAGLRPSEIGGLRWDEWTGDELQVKRSVWRGQAGDTKTGSAAGSVPVIEPLRGLLEKLCAASDGTGYIFKNSAGKPLSLDSLNFRVIAPTLKAAGIEWHGYQPGRRGISSLMTETSTALNSTGLLRHSTPITALRHYTRAHKKDITAALEHIEELAADAKESQKEVVN
jgi:integrase